MAKDGSSCKVEIWTLVVNVVTAIATTAVAVMALRSSRAANAIAMQSVAVAKISADLQLRLDSLSEERKEPNLTMLRASGTATEFVYTLQNTGEKDVVILELSFSPLDDADKQRAGKQEVLASSMQQDEGTKHLIDLSTRPLADRYQLGRPIIIDSGGVVQMIVKVEPNIPYGVLCAVYNDAKHLELSHTHIIRGTRE